MSAVRKIYHDSNVGFEGEIQNLIPGESEGHFSSQSTKIAVAIHLLKSPVPQNLSDATSLLKEIIEEDKGEVRTLASSEFANDLSSQSISHAIAIHLLKSPIPQNWSEAIAILEELIDSECDTDPSLLCTYGWVHTIGRGLDVNHQKAYDLFLKAAELGSTDGIYNIGVSYAKLRVRTKRPEQQYEEAIRWYEKAAALDHVGAEYNLGFLFSSKKPEAPTNPEESYKWFARAADHGHPEAMLSLGVLAYQRGGRLNDQRAFEWFSKAAELGFEPAVSNLGSMYEHGRGVEQDLEKALSLYVQAAEAGNMDAQYNAGSMYGRNLGVPEYIENAMAEALKWYAHAANQGDLESDQYATNIISRHPELSYVYNQYTDHKVAQPTAPNALDEEQKADDLSRTFESELSKTQLADVLKSIRDSHGISQRAFAKVAGVNHSDIQRIESGKGTLDKMHEALVNLGASTKIVVTLPDIDII